ncbi:MAG TPA: ABC transporter substrate binding protein [Bryobacteraceae bacterium]|nr:ABC transporter substrate binding protein [Bryobacteraceae bacterium]
MKLRIYTVLSIASCLLQAQAPFRDNAGHADQPTVIIATSSAIEAFEEAVKGIQQGLGSSAKILVLDLSAKSPENESRLAGKEVRLLITVGNNAYESAARFGTAPILATMLLRSDLAGPGFRAPAGVLALDVPVSEILARMSFVFPGKTRAALIRNPDSHSTSQATLAAQAKSAGMTLKIVDCPRPEKLLQSFLALRGQVDFVICPPDGTLYNGTTVRPLILASLENRLPVVGFSESFVRTGAMAAVYPDYFDVGAQAGELAKKFLSSGAIVASEGPRKLKVAANPRVARLLGLRLPGRNGSDSGVVVIE